MEVSPELDKAITDELNQKVDIMAKGNKPQKNDKKAMKPKKK